MAPGTPCGTSVESTSARPSRLRGFRTRDGELARKTAAATAPTTAAGAGTSRRQPRAGLPSAAATYPGTRRITAGYLTASVSPTARPATAARRRVVPRASGTIAQSETSAPSAKSTSGLAAWLSRAWRKLDARSTPAASAAPGPPAARASATRRPMARPPLPARPLPPRRAALLTVDVEDWFDVNYRSWVPPPAWDPPRRVAEATRRVLDLLAARGRRGTFFVLASAARSAPGLVGAIAAAGHEVACHGLEHTLLYAADPARVERQLGDARRLLEDELG